MGDPVLIIDAHPADLANEDHGGLLHAAGYYARFPEEPSPIGTMKLSATRTATLAVTSLELVLTEMLKAGVGGTVLLVCHAWESGLLFPIVVESKTKAVLSVLTGIEQVTERLKEGEPIRTRAVSDDPKVQQKKADDLQKFLDKQGVISTGVTTLAEATKAYDFWRSGQLTGRLGIKAADPLAVFRRLEKKIAEVRALKLERVELRACEIGNNKSSMQATKRLFGCQKLVAPKQIMFFVSNFSLFASRDRLAAELKPLAVQIGKDEPQRSVAGQPTYAHSWDTADVLATTEARDFKVPVPGGTAVFTLWIGEQQNSPFVFNARGVTAPAPGTRAVNFATVTAFVKQAIFPSAAALSGQFPLCGMFLRPRRFLLPREADYLSNLVQE